jgi:5'-phosphate synthase pdxT subunit
MKVGVLAIQGDYEAHRSVLEQLGAKPTLVRKPEDLDTVEALIIPGGESSTFLKFLEQGRFFERLREFVRTKPTFGTCAGAILLAREVVGPEQTSLGALDIRVRRNAYGRQLESSIRQGELKGAPIEMVFIRAPKIEQIGPGVEVLARQGVDPVLVRQGKIMAATFHPELSHDHRIHRDFLALAAEPSTTK